MYPRMMLRRDSFYSLDGTWQLNDHDITVPYCPQAKASGYKGEVSERMEYVRHFTLPQGFVKENDKVILHFGAVDQRCQVILNNHSLGTNEGGYLPFSFEITSLLKEDNELKVLVVDDLDNFYPYGKQTNEPHGMWYTPVSGIWQSVWIEAYDRSGIDELEINADCKSLHLKIKSDADKFKITISPKKNDISKKEKPVSLQEIDISKKEITISISEPHLWSPEDPYLYDLKIETEHDTVYSYFALREFKTENQVLYLNGSPLFMTGLLDQGYHPEGLLTMTSEQLEQDVLNMKELGFNTLRKHIKVESDAFYYYCDLHGMLVMQDFVNSGPYSFLVDTILPTIGFNKKKKIIDRKRYEFFLKQAEGTINLLKNHPSLIGYTIYNEGWGQQAASATYDRLKPLDPKRLFDSTSGWFHDDHSDFDSYHIYFRNKVLKKGKNLLFLSECGGFTRAIEGHLYDSSKSYGYGKTESEEALTAKIGEMYEKMVLPSMDNGLMGFIYTQVSDIETEINGLYTYDREICKVNKQELRKMNLDLQEKYRQLNRR